MFSDYLVIIHTTKDKFFTIHFSVSEIFHTFANNYLNFCSFFLHLVTNYQRMIYQTRKNE